MKMVVIAPLILVAASAFAAPSVEKIVDVANRTYALAESMYVEPADITLCVDDYEICCRYIPSESRMECHYMQGAE